MAYKYGSQIEVTCNQGYYLTGTSTRHCDGNGQCSGTEPTCLNECSVIGSFCSTIKDFQLIVKACSIHAIGSFDNNTG